MLRRASYEELVYTLPSRYPDIVLSTLVVAPSGTRPNLSLLIEEIQGLLDHSRGD